MTCEEMRKRRENNTVRLRKEKREDELYKRRNIRLGDEQSIDDVDLEENFLEVFSEDNLKDLFSDEVGRQERAVAAFNRVLNIDFFVDKRNAPIEETVSLGLVHRFVEFVASGATAQLRRDAVSVLGVVAAGSSVHTDSVVQTGIIPTLVGLLSSSDTELRDRSVLAIGNIAGDKSSNRDLCIENGAIQALIQVLNQTKTSDEVVNAVWALSNLCSGKSPPPDFDQVALLCLYGKLQPLLILNIMTRVSVMLPALAKQLFSQNQSVLAFACRAIGFLSDGPNEQIEFVVQSGVVRRIVELLMHPNFRVSNSALKAVANIVSGDDRQTQAVLSCSALSCLQKLLVTGKECTKREVCYTLSNIFAGNRKQIQAVIDAHILPPLIQVLSSGDFRTRKEACWAISNALKGGSGTQVAIIVREGAVLPLCDLLTVMDPGIVKIALCALSTILKHGENIKDKTKTGINPYCVIIEEARGVDKLEFLQQSEMLEICVQAYDLYDAYFAHQDTITGDGCDNCVVHSPDEKDLIFVACAHSSIPLVLVDSFLYTIFWLIAGYFG
uniref:Importin subunit alpha n=1 Tax=Syphacia muris TaxID=451379 RepID=A0A0N5AJU3_9BILA